MSYSEACLQVSFVFFFASLSLSPLFFDSHYAALLGKRRIPPHPHHTLLAFDPPPPHTQLLPFSPLDCFCFLFLLLLLSFNKNIIYTLVFRNAAPYNPYSFLIKKTYKDTSQDTKGLFFSPLPQKSPPPTSRLPSTPPPPRSRHSSSQRVATATRQTPVKSHTHTLTHTPAPKDE